MRLLGVTEHVWLDYEDGGCADADPEPAVRRLAGLFDDVRPDTVLTFGPDGFTGHPDHRTVSHWVDLALARSRAAPRLLHAVATAQDRVDPELDDGLRGLRARPAADVRAGRAGPSARPRAATSLRRKVAALQAQASQTTGLIEAVGLDRFTAWVAVEAFADPEPAAARGTLRPHGA